MGARFSTWWQRIRIHPVRTVLVALLAVVIVLIILSILGYIFNWGWTGLGPYISPLHPKDSDFQRGKTLWDWLQLLIIPAVLAVAGYIINLTISRGEQEATEQRVRSEQKAAEKRAKIEREIATDNQREFALQAYIDKMSELLLEKHLRESQPDDEVRNIARVQTLTVLHRLDARRKRNLLGFLYESRFLDKDKLIIDMRGANFSGAALFDMDLSNANLNSVSFYQADLQNTDLSYANLFRAYLTEANLVGANLVGARLVGANLGRGIFGKADFSRANLSGAILSNAILSNAILSMAELSEADLSQANLISANLSHTNLSESNLSGANLSDADLSYTQLNTTVALLT